MTIGAFNPAGKATWPTAPSQQERSAAKAECGFAQILEIRPSEPKTPETRAATGDAAAVGIGNPEPDRLPFVVDGEDLSDLPVMPPEDGPSPQVLLMHKVFFSQSGNWMIDPVPDAPFGSEPKG